MGLFSFTQEIAMDLGTANTIIITNGKIVVDEPSVVALDRRTEKMIAVTAINTARILDIILLDIGIFFLFTLSIILPFCDGSRHADSV